MARRELVVALVSDSTQFNRGFDQAEGKVKSFGKEADRAASGGMNKLDTRVGAVRASLGSLAAGIGAVAVGSKLVSFAQDSIQAFSDLEQSIGGVETVFGRAGDVVREFAETADQSVGLSESAFNSLSTQIGGMLQNLGFSADEAATKTIGLIEIGADLAATYGGSVQQAVEAVGSALRGETDPLERFAISVKQADVNARAIALGLADTTSEVDKNAKAMATLDLIYSQAASTTGQFAREADTVAGKTERLQAHYENVQATVGEKLLPAYIELLEVAGELVPVLESVANHVADSSGDIALILGPLADLIGFINGAGDAADDAEEGFNILDRALGAVGLTLKSMLNPIGLWKDTFEELNASNVSVDFEAIAASVGAADRRFIEAGSSLASLTSTTSSASDASSEIAATFTDAASEARFYRDQVRGLEDAQRGATQAFLEAADPAFAAASAMGRLRDAEASLQEVREDADASATDLAEAELAVAEARLATQSALNNLDEASLIQVFDTLAEAMGGSTDDARELLEQLGLLDGLEVTTVVNTKFTTSGSPPPGASAGGGGGSGIISGARAAGGPVTKGLAYKVGEKGEELFVPNQNGTIVPNGGFGGPSIQLYQTFQRVDGPNLAEDINRGLLVSGLSRLAETAGV